MNIEKNKEESVAPEPDETSTSSAPVRRGRWYQRLKDRLWGYDFFISYHWASGGTYAVNLAALLREKGYEVFLDRAEYAMGDKWKQIGEVALRNTQRLVLIATREAVFESKPVEREVVLFTDRSRHCIPIFFGDTFTALEHANPGNFIVLDRLPDDTLHIEDSIENLATGPSSDVVDKLSAAHGIMRRRKLRQSITLIAVALLAVLALAASVSAIRANVAKNREEKARISETEARRKETIAKEEAVKQLRRSSTTRVIAESRNALSNGFPERAVLLAMEAVRRAKQYGLLDLIANEKGPAFRALYDVVTNTGLMCIGAHPSGIETIAFDSTGRFLATVSKDGEAAVRDLLYEEPRPTESALKTESLVQTVSFSPDGRYIALGMRDGTLLLRPMTEGGVRPTSFSLAGHRGVVSKIAFSGDGKRIATSSYDHTVRIWELGAEELAEEPLFVFQGAPNVASNEQPFVAKRSGFIDVDFSPDGRFVAAVCDKECSIWDLSAENPAESSFKIPGHATYGIVRCAAFSPRGTFLAISSSTPQSDITGSAENDRGVVLDRTISFGCDSMIRIVDLDRTREIVYEHEYLKMRINDLEFSLDGRFLVIVPNDLTFRVCGLMGDTPLRSLPVDVSGHEDVVTCIAFSPDGLRFASAALDGTVRIWNLPLFGWWNEKRPVRHAARVNHGERFSEGRVESIAMSPNARTLAVIGDSQIRLLDVELDSTRAVCDIVEVPPGGFWSKRAVAFDTAGSRLAAANIGGEVRVWNVVHGHATEPRSLRMEGDSNSAASLAFSPDGRLLAATAEMNLCVWQLDAPAWPTEPLMRLTVGGDVKSLAFSPDSRLLAGGAANTVRIWNIPEQNSALQSVDAVDDGDKKSLVQVEPLSEIQLEDEANAPIHLFFDARRRLIVVYNHEVRTFDPATKYRSASLPVMRIDDEADTFSIGPSHLLAMSIFEGALWNFSQRAPSSHAVTVGTGEVTAHDSTALDRYGRWSAKARRYQDFVLLEPLSYRHPGLEQRFESLVADVVNLDILLNLASYRVARNLTRAEWEYFLPEDSYRATIPEIRQSSFEE